MTTTHNRSSLLSTGWQQRDWRDADRENPKRHKSLSPVRPDQNRCKSIKAITNIQRAYRFHLEHSFPRMIHPSSGHLLNPPRTRIIVDDIVSLNDDGDSVDDRILHIIVGGRHLKFRMNESSTCGKGGYATVYAGKLGEMDIAVKVGKLVENNFFRALMNAQRLIKDVNLLIPHPIDVSIDKLQIAIMPRMEYSLGALLDARERIPKSIESRADDPKRDQINISEVITRREDGLNLLKHKGISTLDCYKPENTMIGYDGQTYIGDFSLATFDTSFVKFDLLSDPKSLAAKVLSFTSPDERNSYTLKCVAYKISVTQDNARQEKVADQVAKSYLKINSLDKNNYLLDIFKLEEE